MSEAGLGFVRVYEERKGGESRITVLEKANGDKEERVGGSPAWRNNNPGNLRPSRYNKGQIGEAWGFAVFPDKETGLAAMKALLRRPLYAKLTLEQAILKYAPPADNNPSHAYMMFVSAVSKVGLNRVLKTLDELEFESVVFAMTRFERGIDGRVRRMTA